MGDNTIRIDKFLKQIESEGGVIIRGFRSPSELIAEIQSGLAGNNVVVFVPTTRALRHFFNTEGFVRLASEMIAQLGDVDVLLKPGLYEHRHAFALKSKRSTEPS